MKKYCLEFRVKTSNSNPGEKARQLVLDTNLQYVFEQYGFKLIFPDDIEEEDFYDGETSVEQKQTEAPVDHNHTCTHKYNCKAHRDICMEKYGMKML